MHSFFHKLLLAALGLFWTGSLVAQTEFSASVTPQQITKDEYVQLDLVVTNPSTMPRITPPRLDHFVIVSGPNMSKGIQDIYGKTSVSITLSYVLKPVSTGTFTINPATAKVDGKTMQTQPLRVTVKNGTGSGQPNPGSVFQGMYPFEQQQQEAGYKDYILKKGENAAEKTKKNLFMRVEVNKSSCYVGEPIIATYKLYSRLNSESVIVQSPSFNGFSVIDLQPPTLSVFSKEVYKGREYYVYTIRKSQLYPLLSGSLELEAAEVENNVRFIKEEYVKRSSQVVPELFREFAESSIPPEGIVDEKVSVKNEPLTVTVKPLPEEKKPASFSSAVGRFSLKASLEKNNFSTDDAGKLSIDVSGAGNMQLITAPVVKWPGHVDAFENKSSDDLNKMEVPVSGVKHFEFPFTVQRPGNYSLPAIEFSYFDIAAKSYKTVATQPINFTVSAGNGKPSDSVKIEQPEQERFFNHVFSNRWIIIVPLVVLLLSGLIFWLWRERKQDAAAKKERARLQLIAEQEAKMEAVIIESQVDPLEPCKDLVAYPGQSFYITLNDCLKKYLSKKLGISPEEMNKKIIAERLDRKGASNELVLALQSLMDDIELRSFTPFTDPETAQAIYDKADELIQQIKLSV